MKSNSNETRRNRIARIDYCLLSDATVNDYPGSFIQVLATSWVPVAFSSVEFMESNPINGDFVEQELNISLSGTDRDIEQETESVCGNELIIRLTYTNGEVRIIGTEENPVLLGCTSAGSPVRQTLSCKRKSAEKAKYLLV